MRAALEWNRKAVPTKVRAGVLATNPYGNPETQHRSPMPPTISAAHVQQVRNAAREAAESSSLRIVAREIGIGHSTLHNFLNGAEPHPRVRRILRDWYVERAGGGESQLRPCLDRLTQDLSDHVAKRLRPALAHMLVSGYVESGLDVPAWLDEAARDHSG